jgi:hypothetical protein
MARVVALLAHPDGVQFDKTFVSFKRCDDPGGKLRSIVCSALDVDDARVCLRYKDDTAAAAADGAQKYMYVHSSWEDAAEYVTDFPTDFINEEVDDTVSVDGDKPAICRLLACHPAGCL